MSIPAAMATSAPLSSVLSPVGIHFDDPLCGLAFAEDVLVSCGGDSLLVRSAAAAACGRR